MNTEIIVYRTIVNYGLSLKKMINVGHYDWVSPSFWNGVSKHYRMTLDGKQLMVPTSGKVRLDIVGLIHFGYSISPDNAVIRMKGLGFRPATALELLAFGAKYPDKQRRFSIVALGDVFFSSGHKFVSYLMGNGAEYRRLETQRRECHWGKNSRFLAVRISE